MKKYISVLFFAGLALNLCAQEVATQTDETAEKLVSKKGIAILPVEGEFSLGIDASPIFSYLGSVMSWNGAGSPNMDVPREEYVYGISGKYMTSNTTAIRVNLHTQFSNRKDLYSVRMSELTPDELAPQFVEDATITNTQNFVISLGLEKRRGKSRVQGIYGAEAIIGIDASQLNYEYGNPITVEFNTPTTYWGNYGVNGERLTESSTENNYTFGARGFVGVEFFIGPKISLGGELGYALLYRTQSNTQNTYEYWNTTNLQVEEIVVDNDSKGYNSFGLYTNTSATFKLCFYF